jgi:hypothetical protein
MPLDPSIILGARPPQFDLAQFSPMNALATAAKFKQADQENQLNAQKMAEYERQRTEEENFRNYLATTENPNDPTMRSNFLRYGKTGAAYGENLNKQETAALTQQKTQFDIEKTKREFTAQAFRDTSRNPSDANITAYKEDYLANPLFSKAEKDRMVAGVERLLAMPVNERAPFMASQGASASDLKPSNLQVNQGGQTQVLQMPAFGGAGTSVGTYADVPLPADVQAQNLQRAAAARPVTNVNVSTEKKYGEKLAGNIADRDDAKLGAAEKAPQLAESANRIIDLVKQGNVFTGPIADVKLNVARGLNVLGADNNAKIANTELLIAATGQSTLDAIKSAGLGTGQGFTDKDLNFLRGIAGGKIDFKPETLTELARLQHLAATRSVQAWNTRFKDIPKSSVEGMGLRTAPDVVPLSPSAIFARNPKTGERIQSLDGGDTWKPVGGK